MLEAQRVKIAKMEAKAEKAKAEGASLASAEKEVIVANRLPEEPVIEFKEAIEQPDFLSRLTFLLISISAQLNVMGKKPSLRELISRTDEYGAKFLTYQQLQDLFKHEIPE